jgi:hypothetical protein
MRNLITLFSFLLVMIILIASCKKTTKVITASDLIGNWHFTNLLFHGINYSSCDPALNSYSLSTINIDSVSTTNLKIVDICKSEGINYPFTITENMIIVLPNKSTTSEIYGFTFIDPDKFDGKTLKLEFTSKAASNISCPLGGIYTFTKQ